MNASTMFYTKLGDYRTLHLWRKEEGKKDEEVRLIDTEDLTGKVFYMIEEQQDIDIQNIEEFEIDINNYIQTNLGAFKTRKMDVAFLNKINDLIQAVKQLDRKIREER